MVKIVFQECIKGGKDKIGRRLTAKSPGPEHEGARAGNTDECGCRLYGGGCCHVQA